MRPAGRLGRSSLLCTIVAAGMLGGKAAATQADPPASKTLHRSGTGFFVTRAGELLTSGHILRGCRRIEVWPDEDSMLAASIEAFDARLDVALLATQRRVSRIAVFRAGRVSRNDPAFTIGYGLTASTPLQPVITRGRVNGTVDAKTRRLLVMQATLFEGNSGGPVLDEDGFLIGMVIGRYVSRPNLSVAIRASELARFLDAKGATPRSPADRGPVEDPRQMLRDISALVQCAD